MAEPSVEPSGKNPGDIDPRDIERINEANENYEEAKEKFDKATTEEEKKQLKEIKIEAHKSLLKVQLDITTKLTEKRITDTEQSTAVKNVFEEFTSHINSDEYYDNNEGNFDFDKLKKNFFDTKGNINYSTLGIDTKHIPDANKGTKELLDKLVPDLANSVSSINRSIPDAIKRAMEGVKGLDDSNTQANAEAVGEAANRAAESITPRDEAEYSKKANQRTIELTKDGVTDTSNQRNYSLKDLVKFIGALVKVLSIGALLWIAASWGLAHSGCMQISCDQDDTFPTETKVFCYAKPGTGINIFNPGQGITNYSSESCTCDPIDKSKSCNITCDGDSICNNPDNYGCIRPWINGCTPGTKGACSGDITCPKVTYQYKVFNPLSFIPGLINAAGNAAGKGASKILEAIETIAIIAGIVIGVLLLLYLVGEFIIKQKGTNDYGKYLGNIGKFKNYGYLGKCNNIIPSRFGSF
jgi:hypothetical protein